MYTRYSEEDINEMKEPLIFELSRTGRKACGFQKVDISGLIPPEYLRTNPPPLPELSELDVVRHFTRLSQLNYCVDTTMYPLGSCTMKYNPKFNELIAQDSKWMDLHPYQKEELLQGILGLLYQIQGYLCQITGMDSATLQPAAGAHGELTGLFLIRAYHKGRKQVRRKIIVPDSSHGTNPSSAHIAGFTVVTIPSGKDGEVDISALEAQLDNDTAGVMLTNPNTLGIFETRILKIAELVHKNGALLYCDGANLNPLLGRFRPGDMGFDVMHINLHKTFGTPHGGGGPGSGPVLVKKCLEPYLPVPIVEYKDGKYLLQYNRPNSIGRVRAFCGNIGVVIKAYAYIRALGNEGLKKVGTYSVLNANYMRVKLMNYYYLPYKRMCMHEFVLSSQTHSASDVAKRLLDYGFYAPTVHFPLIVPEAIMIEPTETESKDQLDRFIKALVDIDKEPPEIVKNSPHNLPVRRLDEVNAARNLDIVWQQ